MKIVVADDLPASALDLLRTEGWEVDARTGRTPDQLAGDLADADALERYGGIMEALWSAAERVMSDEKLARKRPGDPSALRAVNRAEAQERRRAHRAARERQRARRAPRD